MALYSILDVVPSITQNHKASCFDVSSICSIAPFLSDYLFRFAWKRTRLARRKQTFNLQHSDISTHKAASSAESHTSEVRKGSQFTNPLQDTFCQHFETIPLAGFELRFISLFQRIRSRLEVQPEQLWGSSWLFSNQCHSVRNCAQDE